MRKIDEMVGKWKLKLPVVSFVVNSVVCVTVLSEISIGSRQPYSYSQYLLNLQTLVTSRPAGQSKWHESNSTSVLKEAAQVTQPRCHCPPSNGGSIMVA